MKKRNVVKNAVWCLMDVAVMPVVVPLALATGEHDKARSLAADIQYHVDSLIEAVAKKEEPEYDDNDFESEYDDAGGDQTAGAPGEAGADAGAGEQ